MMDNTLVNEQIDLVDTDEEFEFDDDDLGQAFEDTDEDGDDFEFDDDELDQSLDDTAEDLDDITDDLDLDSDSDLEDNTDDDMSDMDEALDDMDEDLAGLGGVIDDSTNFDDLSFDNLDDSNTDATDATDATDGEQYNPEDYADGAIADNVDLHEDDDNSEVDLSSNFYTDSGNIVVQHADDSEDGFKIQYIDIDKIAITNRIRKMEPVDALVQSIKSTGLLEPLVVARTINPNLFVLLSGYRRIQACARAGKTKIPCIINTKVSTTEVPILEAMYNHQKRYSMKEQIDYIDYLEKEKGILNPAMIEYLLQMNNGDYTKLKDILNDNDEDIVTKLYDGIYDIATAFKKLEARRKKESREEKENKLAEGVYSDEEESGADQIQGSGEEADNTPLTDEQIQSLAINLDDFEEAAEDINLAATVEEDDNLKGFEDNQQKVGERECLDPNIRKAALIRDRGTCQCCKLGGPQMVNNLDAHHVIPVFLGGKDNVDNTIMLCLNCHRSVHLYATKDLTVDKALYKNSFDELDEESKLLYQNEQIFEHLKSTYKKIVVLGGNIRKGMAQRGINREQYKKEHPNHEVGRRMPGKNGVQTTA